MSGCRCYGESTRCNSETCMKLPGGKTCGDCVHIQRCEAFGFAGKGDVPAREETSCDFFPRRFRLAVVAAVTAILVSGCHAQEIEVTPNGGTDCVGACVQLRAICAAQECPEDVINMSAPTPDGAKCEEWRCRQAVPHEKNTCLAQARTPSGARACKGVGR